jgi:predicted ATP-grasp superfamily ATP-dependent carboligase
MNRKLPANGDGAIVIGGNYGGLGIVRSLGRRGIAVCVITDEHTLGGFSRFARYRLAWPQSSDEDRLKFLFELGSRPEFTGWTLFPTGDETAALIAKSYAQLTTRFVLTTPPWETLRWAYDKRLTYTLAGSLGIPYPHTLYPQGREDPVLRDVIFPMILKPAAKSEPSRFTREKAWVVTDRAQLITRYDEASTMIEPSKIMLQELIPGSGDCQFSYAALLDQGKPLASIVALRQRQHPIDFGRSSSYVVSIEQPEVESWARKILAHMRFTGLVEVEFKRDPRDGEFKLLDINPRVWGWHSLCARAGVDFPFLTWQFVHGVALDEMRARAGVHWVRMTTDVLAALQAFRRRNLSIYWYLKSLQRPMEFAIWTKDDPVPVLLEVPSLLYARMKMRHATNHSTRSLHMPNEP